MVNSGGHARKLNRWQQLPAASYGIITPGNVISFVGGILIVVGFLQIIDESWLLGASLVGAGRLMDILDGYVARHTKTASRLGAFVDVVIDKLTILFALVVILRYELIPAFVIVLIGLQNTVNVMAFFIAWQRKKGSPTTHVSRDGKLAMFYSWITIVSFLAAGGLEFNGQTELGTAAQVAGYGSLLFFVWLGVSASLDYFRKAMSVAR